MSVLACLKEYVNVPTPMLWMKQTSLRTRRRQREQHVLWHDNEIEGLPQWQTF